MGGIFTWYITKRNLSRSELTILTTLPVRLIEVDTTVSELVELRVRGRQVPTVYTQDIIIKNTGTEPIHDGNISFSLSDDSQILIVDVVDSPRGGSEALTPAVGTQVQR